MGSERVCVPATNQFVEVIPSEIGTPDHYTQKGRQLASVQISTSGGPRPFALEGLAARFEPNIRDGAASTPAYRAASNREVSYTLDERLGLSADLPLLLTVDETASLLRQRERVSTRWSKEGSFRA